MRPVDLYFGGSDSGRRSEITALLSPAKGKRSKRAAAVSRETGSARKAAGDVSRETEALAPAVSTADPQQASKKAGRAPVASPCPLERSGAVIAPVSRETAAGEERPAEKAAESAIVAEEAVATADVSRETEEVELVSVPGVYLAELSPAVIVPNAKQPRTVFNEAEVEELVASIREVGLLQPIVVRPLAPEDERRRTGRRVGAADSDDVIQGEFELIMGERRLRAAQRAGLELVPAIVRATSDEDMLRDALLENLHRAQLNPLEEAAAYEQLLREFGCSQEELSKRIARSRPHISNTMRLLKLPGTVQRRVSDCQLTAGHARALLGLADAESMERVAERIVAEGLSVRAVEEIVAMGDDPMEIEPRQRASRAPLAAPYRIVAGYLGAQLDTKVRVTLGARKGRIAIDFRDAADLERILSVLSPSIVFKAEELEEGSEPHPE